MAATQAPPAVVLDVDGTLVDSVYQHTLAWARVLRDAGHEVPLWRVHRCIGMGGAQLVAELTDISADDERAAQLDEAESDAFSELAGEVVALPGARELARALGERDHRVVVASSSGQDKVQRWIELAGIDELVAGFTSSADVERAKPEPDVVRAALEVVGGPPAVMVGDAPWDVQAALRCGIPGLAVRTGGFADAELRQAGAVAVYDSLAQLAEQLDTAPFLAGS